MRSYAELAAEAEVAQAGLVDAQDRLKELDVKAAAGEELDGGEYSQAITQQRVRALRVQELTRQRDTARALEEAKAGKARRDALAEAAAANPLLNELDFTRKFIAAEKAVSELYDAYKAKDAAFRQLARDAAAVGFRQVLPGDDGDGIVHQGYSPSAQAHMGPPVRVRIGGRLYKPAGDNTWAAFVRKVRAFQ